MQKIALKHFLLNLSRMSEFCVLGTKFKISHSPRKLPKKPRRRPIQKQSCPYNLRRRDCFGKVVKPNPRQRKDFNSRRSKHMLRKVTHPQVLTRELCAIHSNISVPQLRVRTPPFKHLHHCQHHHSAMRKRCPFDNPTFKASQAPRNPKRPEQTPKKRQSRAYNLKLKNCFRKVLKPNSNQIEDFLCRRSECALKSGTSTRFDKNIIRYTRKNIRASVARKTRSSSSI